MIYCLIFEEEMFMSEIESRPVRLPDGRIVKIPPSTGWPEEEFVDGKWVPFKDDSLPLGALWDVSSISDSELKELNIKL